MTLHELTLLLDFIAAWVEVVGDLESSVRGDGAELGLHAFRVRVWMGGKRGQDVDVVGVNCAAAAHAQCLAQLFSPP